jgi:D-alanine-D-alanine ligase
MQRLRGHGQFGGGEKPMRVRYTEAADREAIIDLLRATDFFYEAEIVVATEVLDDALAKGPSGDYQSFCCEGDGGLAVGWVCFGATPCTQGTFDIYWLAVSPAAQGRGIGRLLMADAERRIAEGGGRLAVVETAGREAYLPTRRFYERVGYAEAARVADFYAPGDDKVIYTKRLERS